jgi:hypothetical protein
MGYKIYRERHVRNQYSVGELKIESALTNILDYRKKWICHIDNAER